MKCLILVEKGFILLNETRKLSPLLYVSAITSMQNKSANSMYTV